MPTTLPAKDMSFADFLERRSRTLSPATRLMATMVAEGFDAADITQSSAHEILQEWSGDSAASAPTFRPENGYPTVLRALAGKFGGAIESGRRAAREIAQTIDGRD